MTQMSLFQMEVLLAGRSANGVLIGPAGSGRRLCHGAGPVLDVEMDGS